MYVGTSLALIAVGAILKFAVTATVAGVDIQTAGVILMVVGGLGLLFSLVQMFAMNEPRGPGGDTRVMRERERDYR
jgi:Flp pilus assembly protein protease CpaA